MAPPGSRYFTIRFCGLHLTLTSNLPWKTEIFCGRYCRGKIVNLLLDETAGCISYLAQEIPMTITPTEALAQQAHCRPDSTAFTFREDVWTYRRLADESECVARGLARSGVKAGDRVALHMVNRPEMLVAYYACFRLGAIATPIRTVLIQAELARILQRLQPALYIGESALYANVAPIDTAILPREKRFVVGDVDQSHAVQPWEALKQAPQSELPIPPSDRIAVLMETSGNTGQPKLIAHTLDTLAEMAELIYKAFGLAEQDVIVSPLRLAHGTGLYCSLTFVRFGLPFFMLQTFDADIVLDAVERYRGTWLLGFPYQYAGLIEAQQAKPRNVSSLRMCLTGADVCPVDLQNRFASVFGVPLRNIWGSTEGAGQLAFGLQPGPVLRIGEERQVRIVDEDGADVARDEVGELLIHGPGVFVGYWNDPAETAASLKDGWYHTGDLVRHGGGNEIRFVSRKKDIIIRGGTNISPAEVEEALLACHPAVEEAGAVGKPDPVLGQRVFAFIKLAADAKEGVVAEILQNVARRLAPYKVPEGLGVISALPRAGLGKVDRRALERMVSNN
jgi:long-chain acyl-CoA synthetase